MNSESSKQTADIAFLLEAARFFDGTASAAKEDIAFWANTQNAAHCRRIAETTADMLAALQNAKGFLDTPISRRRNDGDSFYSETVKSINDAISGKRPQSPPKPSGDGDGKHRNPS